MKIITLDAAACQAFQAQLAELLLDALACGPCLGFPTTLGQAGARRYWQGLGAELAGGSRLLLAAAHEGVLIGVVQVDLCPQAQDGRCAELQKMIVHSRVRRRGIGSVLLRAAEAEARARGRGLLSLSTEAGSAAEQLYQWQGYTRVAAAPDRQRASWTRDLFAEALA
jgi:acetyltransferase